MSVLGEKSTVHAEHYYKPSIQVPSLEHFQRILDSTEQQLTDFATDMSYLGFDKDKIAKLAAERLGAFRTVKFCLLGGMRGTNLDNIMKKSVKIDGDVKEAWERKLILKNGAGPNDLTMGRLMATFPEIVAHYMSKHNIPKKVPDSVCPSALQFPAAAGLPMNHTVRLQHVEFAVKFSFLISPDKMFHATYYRAAFNGQQPVKRLNRGLSEICGNPTDHESKAVDVESMFLGLAEKYGKERIVLTEPQLRGVGSGHGGVPLSQQIS